tara:strand:- start:271 stop:438 length:168 start_codon:yes stop_codon:yes gene_type:complete
MTLSKDQKAILKAIDRIPSFVINEGDIELITLSRFVDLDPENATRKFLVIKIAWD